MKHDGPIALAETASIRSNEVRTVRDASSRVRGRDGERERAEPGTVIGGRYEIAQFVAEGSFGAVYRAHDLEVSGHVVALKLMHRPPASEREQALCLREVQLIAAIHHPSVVSFKDHGLHHGRFYIVMPWFEGESLAKRLRDGVALTRAEALSIFRQLSQALAAMHERGIRHQDVKPENILLARFGEGQGDFPVLLDLGVGAWRHEHLPAFTPAYVAPEMARAHLEARTGESKTEVDGKADVFALALTLFDALEPRERELSDCDGSPESLARRAERGVTLPSPRAVRDIMPALSRWLSVDPSERPSAQELVHELDVLTRADERRAERRRAIWRLGPVLSAAVAVAALLAFQLRTERVRSRVKDRRIEQQAAEIDSVRAVALDALKGELGPRLDGEELAREELARARAAFERDREQLARAASRFERANAKLTERNRELERELSLARARSEELERRLGDLGRLRDAPREAQKPLVLEFPKRTSAGGKPRPVL